MESLNTQLQPFFEWLLRTTLQASLLICVIVLLQRILRNRLSIRWHYGLWLLLLVRMSLPWAPQSRASMFNLIPRSTHQQQAEYKQQENGEQSVGSDVAGSEPVESVPASPATTTQESPEAVTATPSINPAVQNPPKLDFARIVKILPLLWLAGALVLAVYVCAGNFNLWRIVKRRRPLTDQKILDLLEDCKAQMGIQTILGIVPTDKVESPALFGFVRPRLLLPHGMIETLSQQELRYILLHELAHLKRHDIYIGWLMSLLQVLHWFNPLVWLAFYRMRSDRELACDALVLARTQNEEPKSYGRIIVNLVERFSRPQRLPGMAGILETKAQLKRRVTMIAKFKKNSYQWSPLAVILIVILACVSLPDAKYTKASETADRESARHISLRRIWTGSEVDATGEPSPDGRYISHFDWITGDLAVYEIATGRTHRLTNKGSWEDSPEFVRSSVWSPDSKQIAYAWYNKNDKYDLRVIGIDGTESRILVSDENYDLVRPCDWSKDGKFILARLLQKVGGEVAALVSVPYGEVQVVKQLRTGCKRMMFAPEDEGIVYDAPPKGESGNRDIFVVSTENGEERALVQHPSHDYALGWGPDGKHLLFASDRMGDCGAWLLRVINGRAKGFPELVKENIGDIRPIGFTQAGAYYYMSQQTLRDVLIVRLDMETGQVLSEPMPVRQTGSTVCHDWSPDGQYLAYCTQRPNESQVIHIRTLATGQERILADNLPYIRWLRWSLDGQSILTDGYKRGDSKGVIRKIDIKTGERSKIVRSKTEVLVRPELSPDGKTLFYGRGDPVSEVHHIVAKDIESGSEKNLLYVSPPDRLLNIALSPNGQRFVFSIVRGQGQNRTSVLKILSVAGGEPKELIQFNEGNRLRGVGVTWMPDNKNVLFWKLFSGSKELELWRMSTEGGDPRRLWSRKSLGHLRVHPDGERIVFNDISTQSGVWVMENFLPEATVAKPAHQPNFKKIRIPTKPGNGVLSPDGKKLAFVSKRSIWVVPVHGKVSYDIAGEPIRLPGIEKAWHWCTSWSADGAWIAYGNPDEICIVPSSGGKVKKIPVEVRGGSNVFDWRISLSRDGRTVAYGSEVKDKMQIFTTDVESGDFKQLTEDGGTQPCFSPDGKRIAYVKPKPQKTSIPKSDVWVRPATGGKPIQVSDLPGRATGPVWSPDGKRIAFTRKAGGDDMSKEICIIPVPESGKPEATPTQIELPLETWRHLAGWTPDNEIGVLLSNPEHQAIYTIGASGGNATQITPQGYAFHPRWSPDGERIYFRWNGGNIASVPSEGGEISTVPLDADSKIFVALPGAGNAVSPDGKKITFSGAKEVLEGEKRRYEVYIYTIPIEGGEPKKLTKSPGQDRFPCWSPDGNSIAFVRYPEPTKEMSICIVPTEGGEVRQLTSESHRVKWSTIAWSPDGKSMAYFSGKNINVIPKEGGEPKAVVKVVDVSDHSELAWSPDVSKLVYSSKGSIWVVSLDGGEPEQIKTGLDAKATHLSWSPDGKKIAFTATRGGDAEFWLMENFLPETVAVTRK